MRPARQTNFVEQRLRARAGIARARDLHRDGDVLKRGQRGDEMEELEDESDLFAPELRELVLAELRDVHAVDQHVPGAWRIEPGNQAEQRGLSAAGRPDDGDKLSVRDVE